jgi:hypothetical protein
MDAVAALLAQAQTLSADQAQALGKAWDAAGDEVLRGAESACKAAGRDWDGVMRQAKHTFLRANWPRTGYNTQRAIADVVLAVFSRDLVSEDGFALLTAPWRAVVGEVPGGS